MGTSCFLPYVQYSTFPAGKSSRFVNKSKTAGGRAWTPALGGSFSCGDGCGINQTSAGNAAQKDAYSIFFSSSYTNCTLVPMMTWQVVLSGRMTPAAPAALTAFSSTAV